MVADRAVITPCMHHPSMPYGNVVFGEWAEVQRGCILQNSHYTSTAIESVGGLMLLVDKSRISRPSQNLGSWLPGTNNLSTPPSVITHMRMTPPEDPSRDIANDKAMYKSASYCRRREYNSRRRTILYEIDRLILSPAFLVSSIAVPVYIRGTRTYSLVSCARRRMF